MRNFRFLALSIIALLSLPTYSHNKSTDFNNKSIHSKSIDQFEPVQKMNKSNYPSSKSTYPSKSIYSKSTNPSKSIQKMNTPKAMDKVPIIFHEKYDISESLNHPFGKGKYVKLFNNLCQKLNLQTEQFYIPDQLNDKDLELVHSREYLESLNKSQVIAQISETPSLSNLPNAFLQKTILDPMRYATSGTILGTKLAKEKRWSVNLSGGYHHAKSCNGEGFCVFADIPLAVSKLHQVNPNLKVMVVDLDAHQGNGCACIFKGDNRIALFDIYNGEIYPNDIKAKQYIKYDFPVKSYTQDKEYLDLLGTELPKAIKEFQPDFIIYNAGTDIFEEDPIGRMSISKNGIMERDSVVFKLALENNIPILMVLSGGYSPKCPDIISDSLKKIILDHKLLI